jgi:hypothetical protein
LRISHICTNCGLDLTRTPAPIDPHLALPVVVCPECRFAVVRREHPTMVWSRWVRRLVWSILALTLRVGTLAPLTAGTLAMCWIVTDTLRHVFKGGRSQSFELVAVQVLTWIVLSFVAGIAAGFWFSHARRWMVAIAWAGWLLAASLVPACVYLLAEIADRTPESAAELWQVFIDAKSVLPDNPFAIAVSGAVGAGGVVVGASIGGWWVRKRRRFAWAMARQRRRRSWMGQLTARL